MANIVQIQIPQITIRTHLAINTILTHKVYGASYDFLKVVSYTKSGAPRVKLLNSKIVETLYDTTHDSKWIVAPADDLCNSNSRNSRACSLGWSTKYQRWQYNGREV